MRALRSLQPMLWAGASAREGAHTCECPFLQRQMQGGWPCCSCRAQLIGFNSR